MDFRKKLAKINYEIMLCEYNKVIAENDMALEMENNKESDENPYHQEYIYEQDEHEYELGLKYGKIILQNGDKLGLEEAFDYPDIAYAYASKLLIKYHIPFLSNYAYKVVDGKPVFESKEKITMQYEKALAIMKDLLDNNKITWFIYQRLKLACQYLYDYYLLYSKEEKKDVTKTHTKN